MPVTNLNNRADLLRWYQQQSEAETWQTSSVFLGYHYQPPIEEEVFNEDKIQIDENDNTVLEKLEDNNLPTQNKSPSKYYYYLAHREQYAEDNDPIPEALRGYKPLNKAELSAVETGNPLSYQPITNKQRLSPFIQKHLRQQRGNKLDINRLIKHLAEQKPLYSVPIKAKNLPVGYVTVLLDLCDRLLPFWRDSYQVCELIQQKQGRFGQDIRVLNEYDITAEYYHYHDFIKRQHKPQQWQSIPAQSAVFIIGDAGQLAPQDSRIRQQWLALLQRLKKRGIKPIIIAPIAPEQQCPLVQSLSHQVLWHKHSLYRPQKYSGDQQNHQQKIAQIIAFLSLSPHIEPELLRAIIETALGAESSGIEAAIYLHPDIQWGYQSINIQLEKREYYQQQLKNQPAQLQKQILKLIKQHHIGQFPAVWYEAVLDAEYIVNFPLAEIADIDAAKTYMQRLAVTGLNQRNHQGLNNYFIRNLGRSSQQQKWANRDGYSALYYALALHRAGEPVPEEYNADMVQRITRKTGAIQQWQIVQVGEQLYLRNQQMNYSSGVLYGNILADFSTPYNAVHSGQQTYSLDKEKIIPLIMPEDQTQYFTLDTGIEKLTFVTVSKPTWANSLSQSQQGLIASLHFADKTHELIPQVTATFPSEQDITWQARESTQEIGFDNYGLYATLRIKNVSQKFRWIEAGSFLMGSLENKKGRESWRGKETQHQVTFSQGFWMADTTVTQAFWQAVMGKNPSRFKEEGNAFSSQQNPVEQVNWDDCQQFIKTLKQHFNQLECHLPTEAQWEYACRAGTQTAFNFIGDLDLEKVNYNGNWDGFSHNEQAKNKTTAVKSYPCNAWGLYEMHGNVWEWCQDSWQSDLGSEPQIDPEFFKVGSRRVVRGGSWSDYGKRVCSATRRNNSLVHYFNGRIGLRLVIGQSSISLQTSFQASSVSERTGSSVKQETVSTDTELAPTNKKSFWSKLNLFK